MNTPEEKSPGQIAGVEKEDAFKVFARRKVRSFVAIIRMIKSLVLFRGSYLYTTGFHRSFAEKRPCLENGMDIPWMNYSFVSLLEEKLPADIDVFEYGSGSSTKFFSLRCASVTSCEHDRDWYEKVSGMLPENAEIMLKSGDKDGEYCRAIAETGKTFDLVLVDGLDRHNCVLQALDQLSPQGVIILDDSHRESYRPSFELLTSSGFRSLTIEGLKPLQKKTHSTTIFYRNGNCLKI